jgi:hypothetical protein
MICPCGGKSKNTLFMDGAKGVWANRCELRSGPGLKGVGTNRELRSLLIIYTTGAGAIAGRQSRFRLTSLGPGTGGVSSSSVALNLFESL